VVAREARKEGVIHFFPEPADEYERELFDRVASWQGPRELSAFDEESLRELSTRESVDFATALLHRSVVESAAHREFLRELRDEWPVSPKTDLAIAIVPGAFYRENPRTGADGHVVREVARKLGLPAEVIPVRSTGRLEENAALVLQWLRERSDRRWLLVSVSKGASDIKAALSRPDAAEAFRSVVGWVSICGILAGTPMADWLLSADWRAQANRLLYRIRGRSLDFLQDFRSATGGPLDRPLLLPTGLRVVHILGFPIRGRFFNALAQRAHVRLRPFGPNDGAMLLGDVGRWPGRICPVWGADHYLNPRRDVRPLLASVLCSFA
jgi:hypothetical protein